MIFYQYTCQLCINFRVITHFQNLDNLKTYRKNVKISHNFGSYKLLDISTVLFLVDYASFDNFFFTLSENK